MPRRIAILNPDGSNPGVFLLEMQSCLKEDVVPAELLGEDLPSAPPPVPRTKEVVGRLQLDPLQISTIVQLLVAARLQFANLDCDIRCGDLLIELLGHTDRFYIEMPDGSWRQEVEARKLLELLSWMRKTELPNGTLLRRKSDGALIAQRAGMKKLWIVEK